MCGWPAHMKSHHWQLRGVFGPKPRLRHQVCYSFHWARLELVTLKMLFAYRSGNQRKGQRWPTPDSCLENLMDGGAWWAAVHGVTKGQTRLSDFTFTFHFHALEKEMATHSSVLTWRIPGTGEPGGLPSAGLQSWTWLKWLSSSSSRQSKPCKGVFSLKGKRKNTEVLFSTWKEHNDPSCLSCW